MLTTGLEPRKPVIVIRRFPAMRPVLLLLAALSAGAYGQSSSQPTPLILGKAALMKTIKSANLKPGDLFYLRTIGPWQQGDCTVASRTTLTATVASSTSSGKGSRRSQLSLLFSPIRCSDAHPTLIRPTLVALEAPSDAVRTNEKSPKSINPRVGCPMKSPYCCTYSLSNTCEAVSSMS